MLEMKAALFAVQVYAKGFFNCTVHFDVNSTSILSCINKQTVPNKNIFKIV